MKKFLRSIDIPDEFTGCAYIAGEKTTRYLLNGKPHRLDGPALLREEGWGIPLKYHISGNTGTHQYYFVEGERIYDEAEYWNHPKVLEHKLNLIIDL